MNTLRVSGDQKELGRFRTAVWKSEEQPLDFNGTVPIPAELDGGQSPSNLPKAKQLDLIMKYGHPDWYSWQLANWGCKWGPYEGVGDPDEVSYKNGKGKLIYSFDTPWSPPVEWLLNTSKQFPTLKFENHCDEPGAGFKGTITIINGKVIKDAIKDT